MNNDEMIAHVTAQLNLAAQLQAEGRKPQMIAVLRQMLSLQAQGTFWGDVAQRLYQVADLDSAAVAARKFVTTCPDIPQAKLLLAGILGDNGKLGEAIALAKKAAKKIPNDPAVHYSLGVQLSRFNRMKEAKASFAKVLKLDPDHVLAVEYLAYIGKGEAPEESLGIVDNLLERAAYAGKQDAAALHYARATLLERQQDWSSAFKAYEDGAKLMRSVTRVDLGGMERYVERLKESFSDEFFDKNSALMHANKRPVFIVGMPRSGTTLVESVLAAHSGVEAGGESALLGLATMNFGSFEPQDLARVGESIAQGQNPWATMGQALEQLHNVRFAKGLRVTEKNLGHHFFLGVIAMIASGAPIIYCRRDPVPTAWSCYKTRFLRGNGWSYDFESIAHYQRLYTDLMRHWQTVWPGAGVLEVQYEDLVAQPDEVIPRILAHAKLEFEEACLSPHRSGMPVLTATLTQVRDPIHTGAVSAWQHYEPWLAPYVDDLRSA